MEQRGLEKRHGETRSLEGAAVKFPDLDSALADRRQDGENLPFITLVENKKKKEDHVFQCAGGAAYVRAIRSIENIPSARLWADESQPLM